MQPKKMNKVWTLVNTNPSILAELLQQLYHTNVTC